LRKTVAQRRKISPQNTHIHTWKKGGNLFSRQARGHCQSKRKRDMNVYFLAVQSNSDNLGMLIVPTATIPCVFVRWYVDCFLLYNHAFISHFLIFVFRGLSVAAEFIHT
jgi:hypothetical protein